MGFKSARAYNEERYRGLFILRNHGDFADVIFLYRNLDDVLIADTHYVKSADYSGYVHCCGRGCPACAKGLRVQSKLFIPLYNKTTGRIEFWDRSIKFENQLNTDVFLRCDNPSNYTFRIIRNGAAGDINTTYQIQVIGVSDISYNDVLHKFNITLPDYYSTICKDVSAIELSRMLNNTSSSADQSLPSYQVTPRASGTAPSDSSIIPPVHDRVNAEYSLPDDTDSDIDDVGEDVPW